MPYYDYRCKTCNLTIEMEHGMMEELEIPCENCRELMIKQMPTNITGIVPGTSTPCKG